MTHGDGVFRIAFQVLMTLGTLSSAAGADSATFDPPPIEERPRLTATRTRDRIVIDGRLDEQSWSDASDASAFVRYDPDQGGPSRFPTQVRVLFDDHAIYVGVRCDDAAGPGGMRVPDLKRDFNTELHDLFSISFDPFMSGRDAVAFEVNPYGAIRDLQIINDALFEENWDAIWSARTRRDSKGWSVELEIPWRSLRYPAGTRSWGVQLVRVVRREQERSSWSPVPRAFAPYRMQYQGFLDGLVPPPPSRNLLFRPFVLGSVERGAELAGSAGIDAKWAISTSSFLDVTVNTDFAQVDVDRAIVNLTRYGVLFPEKRPFFLESASLFELGTTFLAPFTSRRIGLDDTGAPVPIDGGLRFVSRGADSAVGVMAVSTRGTDTAPRSQFGVVRATHAVAPQLTVGGGLVARHDGGDASDPWNVVPVVDFLARDGAFFIQGMASASFGTSRGEALYTYLYHRSNHIYAGYFTTIATRGYAPATGFVPAPDTVLHSPAVYLDLRPRWKPAWVRKFAPGFEAYVYQGVSDRAFRDAFLDVQFITAEIFSGDSISLGLSPEWHDLQTELVLAPGVTVPAGSYANVRPAAQVRSDESRKWGGSARVELGPFYDGSSLELGASVEVRPIPHLGAAASFQRNIFDGVGGVDSHVDLVATELRVALDPRLQLVGLYQRSTLDSLDAFNVRLAWEVRPLSFLYVVYDDITSPDEAGHDQRRWKLTAKLVWSLQL